MRMYALAGIASVFLVPAAAVMAQQETPRTQADETRAQEDRPTVQEARPMIQEDRSMAQEEATRRYMERARGGVDFPRTNTGLRLLQREVEIGNFGPIDVVIGIPTTPRYLVTYMNSQTGGGIRSATAVSVTNQTDTTCRVAVSYFKGFSNDASPVCTTAFSVPSRFTVDYCSRGLPGTVTTCNSTCDPALTFDEGRAIVASTCRDIGVSARVYYTSGDADNRVDAVSDSKVVRYNGRNAGD